MKNTLKLVTNGKRFLALFIDAFIVFVLSALLNTFVTGTFLFKAIGGQAAENEVFSYVYETGLFNNTPDSNGDYSYSNLNLYSYSASPSDDQITYGYEYYLDMLWCYYTDFLPNKSVDKIEGCSTQEESYRYFYSDVLGLTIPEDLTTLYTEDEVKALVSSDSLFTFTLKDSTSGSSTIDLTQKPTPVYEVNSANADSYMSYFFASSSTAYSGKYYEAAYAFSQTAHFTTLSKNLSNYNWICYLAAFLPVQLIFFYIIPVCLKNNKTIGKLIAKVSVVNENGVKLSGVKRFVRPLVMFAFGFTMIMPFTKIIDIGAWVILVAIDFFIGMFKHDEKVGHDYLYKTVEVEDVGSTIFDNVEELKKWQAENPVVEEDKTIYDHAGVKLTVDDDTPDVADNKEAENK